MKFSELFSKVDYSNQNHRAIPALLLLIATLFFIAIGVLAWTLYKERMLQYDPVFLSFMVIQEGTFFVVHGRYGIIFSQLLPLAILHNVADLKTVLQIYSVSLIVLYVIYLFTIGVAPKDSKGILAL